MHYEDPITLTLEEIFYVTGTSTVEELERLLNRLTSEAQPQQVNYWKRNEDGTYYLCLEPHRPEPGEFDDIYDLYGRDRRGRERAEREIFRMEWRRLRQY